MLSGRYRTEYLCRHWSMNSHGYCQAPSCKEANEVETLSHILLRCPSYELPRKKIVDLWLSTNLHCIFKLVSDVLLGPPEVLLNFILDASTHPTVISLHQTYGDQVFSIVFHLTRTWCFYMHRERAKLLGQWHSL